VDIPLLEIWEAGIDTQCTVHVSGQAATFIDGTFKGNKARVRGVTGRCYTDEYATVPVWGDVLVIKDAPLLLSFAKLSDAYPISWDQDGQLFTVEKDGVEYVSHRRNNTYVCDMRPYIFGVEDNVANISTVEENERLYTKAEVERARKARALSNGGAAPSIKDLAKMLRLGMVQGTDLSPEDLYRAVRIYGPPLTSVRGSTRRHPAPSVGIDSIPHVLVPSGVVMHVDITFAQGVLFFLAVVTPLYYLMCEFLKGRTASVLLNVLLSFVNRLKAFGFVVKAIICDGEGGVAKVKSELEELGIQVHVTAKEHVPLVENKVGQVKARCRGMLNTLPFAVSLALLVYLVYFVVSGVNKIPSSGSSEFIAPETALTGRPVHARLP
jgi:hypothetical protein